MAVSRTIKLLGAGGALAGAAVAAAAVAANPALRDEGRRLRRLARPLGAPQPGAPTPPPLPPGRIVHLPGRGETFIRDTGPPPVDGPPVLLLHGWTACADINFFAVFPELAGRHRVVALDHRGHGRGLRPRTPFSLEDCADDAAALLDELGLERAVVVGYSMGGPIAMLLHHRHPHLVGGLVFCSTALEWHDSPRERLIWRGVSLVEVALRSGTGEGIVARVLREALDSAELEPLEPWVRGEFHRGYPADLAGAGRALAAYDGRPLAPDVDVPCAVVVSTLDQLVRPEKQYELADALGAETFPITADHFAPLNRGPAFAKLIRTAVDRVTEAL